jgi:CubicO group peptidase (beta-lactamase class C family)
MPRPRIQDSGPSVTVMAHKTHEFEKLVHKYMEEWKVPGLSIAVVQGDEVYSKVIASRFDFADLSCI